MLTGRNGAWVLLQFVLFVLLGAPRSAVQPQGLQGTDPTGPVGQLELEVRDAKGELVEMSTDLTLWFIADDAAALTRLPKEIAESGLRADVDAGRGAVTGVPVGFQFQVYMWGHSGYILDRGATPTTSGETVKSTLRLQPWPDELRMKGGVHRPIRGRLVDAEKHPLDARRMAAWTFHSAAGGRVRWDPQSWSADTTKDLGGSEDGSFRFDLVVTHGRPGPGELVFGLRSEEQGMPWIARVPLTAEEDYTGTRLDDVVLQPTPLVVAGLVVDTHGAPVAGAKVTLAPSGRSREHWQYGYPMTTPLGCIRGTSDAAGRFELHGFTETGTIVVQARCEGRDSTFTEDVIEEPVTPGTKDLRIVLRR